jgi:hypothetical protein
MSGVASDTGSISPTMVAKIVIDNIIVTPETKPFNQSHNTKEINMCHDMHQCHGGSRPSECGKIPAEIFSEINDFFSDFL